jgi:hypothetical protein
VKNPFDRANEDSNKLASGTIRPGAAADLPHHLTTAPSAFIHEAAQNKISSFCGTIGANGVYKARVYKGNRSLAAHVTADYHGRFLFELIQNANDAHPLERDDGEVNVFLAADESPFGSLYVANRGRGFTRENVEALCDMGMSSKSPGESIGNKGLGFRSVHHISDAPEIYSQALPYGNKEEFDGYCFGFASDDELDTMFEDTAQRALAREDLPLFHVPTWRAMQSEMVRFFAREGYSTVVRLPLRDKVALDVVRNEITALKKQSAPTLLFLHRLRSLTLTIRESTGESALQLRLMRSELTFNASPQFSIVDLDSAGQFFLAKARVSEASMKDAITEGVAAKQLHPHWEKWAGEGEVALAVRMDDGEIAPRLYTFLPLGVQAAAPFHGYLHGTFFPTSNRKALDAKVGLNKILLKEALALAAKTVVWLSSPERVVDGVGHSEKGRFDQETLARLAVDLLVWNDVDSLEDLTNLAHSMATSVAGYCGVPTLSGSPVVPSFKVTAEDGDTMVWVSPTEAKLWKINHGFFSVRTAAKFGGEFGIAPFRPGLGPRRLQALDNFLDATAEAYSDKPTPQQTGQLAEKVALSLMEDQGPEGIAWSKYYADLSSLLGTYPAQLSGRQVLLCNDGKLRAATGIVVGNQDSAGSAKRVRGKKRAGQLSIFSPAARKVSSQHVTSVASEDFNPPTALAENFGFLYAHLDWHGELSQIRVAFETAKLVLPFDSETLLSQLSNVVHLDDRKQTRFLGLRWAFQIWCRAREAGRPLQIRQNHRFYVPTVEDDYLEAREMLFSRSWGEATLGKDLERLIDAEHTSSNEMGELRTRLIAPTSHKIFAGRNQELWTPFLAELGVKRGLHPVECKLTGMVSAKDLNSFAFCSRIGLAPACAARWKSDVLRHLPPNTLPASKSGEYVIDGKLWTFPGQSDYEKFSPEGRELYALLIAHWLGVSTPAHWEISVHHRYFSNVDYRRWPTPLASFIRSAAWVPVEQPLHGTVHRQYVAPEHVWLNNAQRTERAPVFLRRPIHKLGRLLEKMPEETLDVLAKRAQVRQFDDPTTLIHQVAFLAHQYFIGAVERYYDRQFSNLYNRTWQTLATQWRENPKAPDVIPNFLVVKSNNNLTAIDVSDEEKRPILYVRDQQNDLASNLVALDGGLVFDVGPQAAEEIGALLSAMYPQMIRLGSKVPYRLIVDNVPLEEIAHAETAKSQVPWLPPMIAIAMESLVGTEAQRLPADRGEVLQRLERAGLIFARNIVFKIQDREVPASQTFRQAMCVKTAEQSLILVQVAEEDAPTWHDFEHALPAVCEAIDIPHLFPYLRLLVRELQRTSEALNSLVDLDSALHILGTSLGLSALSIAAARQTVSGDLQRNLKWLRAIVHMLGGEQGLAILDHGSKTVDVHTDAWHALLRRCLSTANVQIDEVIGVCSVSLSSAEIRERLGLELHAFNLSLIATGLIPDTYPELHLRHLRGYVSDNEVALITCLRNAWAPTLAKTLPAPDYARSKMQLTELQPDPGWLPVYKEVPTEVLHKYLNAWLSSVGAPPLHANPHKLPALDAVRTSNAATVRELAITAAPLVRAWCNQRGVTTPAIWCHDDSSVSVLRTALEVAGAFDYLPFSDKSLFQWVVAIGAWPDGMPLSLDRDTLGVTSTDVDQANQKAQKEKEQHEIQARSVPFNGRPVDPRTVDWHALGAELKNGLTRQMLTMPISATGNFVPVRRGSMNNQGARSASKGSSSSRNIPPSEKTDLIGRLGEFAVYYWLKKALPHQDIERAWVSRNRRFLLGGEGNDGLGYDFAIGYRNQKWLIEVKASLDDPQSFEMGETEVRAARTAARNRSGTRYVIAYVRFAATPSLTAVEMLPNPMTEEGEAVLGIVGQGIRYEFRREVASSTKR